MAKTSGDEREQVAKDRRAVLKGAVISGVGLAGTALMLRRARGPAVGVELPPIAAKKVAAAVAPKAVRTAKAAGGRKNAAVVKKPGGGKGALAKSVAKHDQQWSDLRKKPRSFAALGDAVQRQLEKRDGLEKARDVAIIGGSAAAAAGGVVAARQSRKVARKAAETMDQLKPGNIARAGIGAVKRKAKDSIGKHFPTFVKAGKAVRKVFSTPASRLIEFGGRDQLKEVNSNRYGDPLKAAAGLQKVYTRKDGSGNPVIEDLPLAHAQTVKAALRKGEKISRVASRGGRLAKDVVQTIKGTPRAKDAAGRSKKREWEKSWFREGVKKAAIGAGVLGYYGALRKSPRLRKKHQAGVKWASEKANKLVPDLVPRASFSTPASRLLQFDADANAAGWDVRDARGKSARVFAPGSRKRERREKKWHEKTENERKLWKAGLAATAVGAAAAGLAVGKRLPVRKPAAVVAGPSNIIRGKFPKKVG